jgi:type II secretory pathway pseudopilin PulG
MRVERRSREASRTDGFTLTEAIASFAVFGICFGALLTGLTWNVSNIKFARETVRATQIMEDKLDTLRLYSWDQITTPGFITNQFYTQFYPTNALAGSEALGVTYTGLITVATSPLTESYGSNIMRITVDLYWPSSPEVRHAQMSTFVSKYGLQGYVY